MFGYVKPFKPQLKICEFETYKSVYCGLCGQLGKSFGMAARLTLSYDFTFLSMLHIGLSGEAPDMDICRCYVNPLKKTPCVKNSRALGFGADIAAIMLYYKLLDNIADSGFLGKIGWSLLRPFAASARKKAAARMSGADEIIRESMRLQSVVEAGASPGLDEASQASADAMSKLFMLLPADEVTLRVLSRFGYFLGRFVYICDALDDVEADLAHGGYNPLILRFDLKESDAPQLEKAYNYARESLYMTIGEATKAYDLLELSSFRPILDNIVELGMKNSVDEIFSKKAAKSGFKDT